MITPEKFKELQDYFWIQPLFYGLSTIGESGAVEEWRNVEKEIERNIGDLMNEDAYLLNLEWLRERMRPDQIERLRDNITASLSKLKQEWESEYNNLSRRRLDDLLSIYPKNHPDIDEIIQCSNRISFCMYNAIGRLQTALEILTDINDPDQTTSTETVNTEHKEYKEPPSKKPPARPFANFRDKLQNGFTENDLNGLLVHMLIKDPNGNTLGFYRYLLPPIIDALVSEGYFEKGSREKDQKALLRFLGLSETRIKEGYGKPGTESAARQKAITYLQKERKKNRSFCVP